jgi:hypothetical protein
MLDINLKQHRPFIDTIHKNTEHQLFALRLKNNLHLLSAGAGTPPDGTGPQQHRHLRFGPHGQ